MKNLARRSEEWHLNRDWVVFLLSALFLIAIKLGLAIPWNELLPAWAQGGAHFQIRIALAGLLVGILVGMTGMGSGALMAPLLILILKVKPSLAIGSDLVYATITKVFGAFQHYKHGSVHVRLTAWLAIGSVPGALLGAESVELIHRSYGDGAEHFITKVLAITFMLVSTSIILRTFLPIKSYSKANMENFSLTRKILTPILGFLVGFLVGLTSVGSGSLLMPILIMFYPMPTSTLVGTDIFHAVLLTGAAGASHFMAGNVDLILVSNLLIGSVPGIVLGSRLVKVVPERLLRTILAIVLFLTGWKLWLN